MEIQVNYEYTMVLAIVIFNVMTFYVQNYVYAGVARSKHFNSNTLSKSYENHKSAYPEDKEMPQSGYPDDGNGVYADKMSYKDWY